MTYVIAQPCVDLKDRACVDECPVDCIYEGKRMLYIHPDECVDCGACEPVCPVEAIYYEDDTPEQWKEYYDANVHFFDDLGSPGGAAKMGEIDKDHPLIEALPPQAAGGLTAPARHADLGDGSRTSPGTSSRRTPSGRAAHPDGIVDLSVGTPVDPTPEVVQEALRDGRRLARLPGHGRPAGDPAGGASTGSRAVTASPVWTSTGVLPVIGSKELIASLPLHLGIGPGDLVVQPGAGLPDVRGRVRCSPAPRCSPPTR